MISRTRLMDNMPSNANSMAADALWPAENFFSQNGIESAFLNPRRLQIQFHGSPDPFLDHRWQRSETTACVDHVQFSTRRVAPRSRSNKILNC